MKSVDVKSITYIDFNKENNKEDPKFKVGDHVRISKCKTFFSKGYTPNWSEVFVITKVKNTILWTYVISDFKCEDIVVKFYKKTIAKNKSKRI